jgi:predicted flavoprotein YhiN
LAYRTSLFDIQKGFVINWVPHTNMLDEFKTAKQCNGRKTITGIISEYLPIRIARWIGQNDTRNVADVKDMELMKIAERIHKYEIPAGNAKYHSMTSAEVTFGGVDTNDISSKTMESKLCPGLYFAGEVIDITGDLGGFNLQWAWASGRVAGMNACAE